MGNQALPGSRETVFRVDPRYLTIVGEDPEHPAYNPERLDGFKLNENTLADFLTRGVLEDVICRKEKSPPKALHKRGQVTYGKALPDGNWLVVFAGRGRTMHAVELVSRGHKDFTVPVRLERGDDLYMAGSVLAENAHRRDSDPLTRAREAFRYFNRAGKNLKLTAQTCNVTTQTIQDWWALLEGAPKLHEAVKGGQISGTVAVRLAKLARPEQETALADMIAKGEVTKASAETRVKQAKAKRKGATADETPETNAPKRRVLRLVAERLAVGPDRARLIADVLRWAIDGTRPPEMVREALAFLRKEKRFTGKEAEKPQVKLAAGTPPEKEGQPW